MGITIATLPVHQDNYAWVIHNETNAAVVDPGDAGVVTRFCEKNKLALSAILLTHHHDDHCSGTAELAKKYACPVVGPKDPRMPFVTYHVSEGRNFSLLGKSA